MTARNDITGDSIANNKGDSKKYADNWEKIFGNKDKEKPKEETKVVKRKKKEPRKLEYFMA